MLKLTLAQQIGHHPAYGLLTLYSPEAVAPTRNGLRPPSLRSRLLLTTASGSLEETSEELYPAHRHNSFKEAYSRHESGDQRSPKNFHTGKTHRSIELSSHRHHQQTPGAHHQQAGHQLTQDFTQRLSRAVTHGLLYADHHSLITGLRRCPPHKAISSLYRFRKASP